MSNPRWYTAATADEDAGRTGMVMGPSGFREWDRAGKLRLALVGPNARAIAAGFRNRRVLRAAGYEGVLP